jgi:hypothetical protein
MRELLHVAERHPDDDQLFDLLSRLRVRQSLREPDGCSLTCTQASLYESATQKTVADSYARGSHSSASCKGRSSRGANRWHMQRTMDVD